MAPPPPHPDPDPGARRITLRSPAALAAALPYLIEPSEQARIVMTVLGPDRMLRLIAERPLPVLPGSGSPEVLQHWSGLTARVITDGVADLDLRPGEGVAAVLFLPAGESSGLEPTSKGIRLLLPDSGAVPAQLLDILLVADGRWRSLLCSDPACCPGAGRPVMADRDAVAVVADLIEAGMEDQPRLTDDPIPAPPPTAVAAALARLAYPTTADLRRDVLVRAWPAARHMPSVLTADDAALLILASDRPGIRDALLARMARSDWSASADAWRQQWRLWRSVADVAPVGWAAGPRCLEAVSAWALEQRAAACRALLAAQHDQPGHRMGVLLAQLMATDAVAHQWFAGITRLAESDCLLFDRPPPPRAAPGGTGLLDTG
jgi:hypothetical protein